MTNCFRKILIASILPVPFSDPSDMAISIRNEVDLSRLGTAGELVLRVHSSVNNEDRSFYTDANGFQVAINLH